MQGSRDAPYLVRMRFSMLSSTDWKKVTQASSPRIPMLGVALASGQMPESIEEVFERLGLSLFPRANGDLKTACSCPDHANPCKHVAAVYYLLGEEIDRDPFLLFRLRGIERDELLDGARRTAARHADAAAAAAPGGARARQRRASPSDAVEDDDDADAGDEERRRRRRRRRATATRELRRRRPRGPRIRSSRSRRPSRCPPSRTPSGRAATSPAQEVRESRIPAVPAALTKRLGALPFARGEDPSALLERIYRNASHGGLEVFLGERAEES